MLKKTYFATMERYNGNEYAGKSWIVKQVPMWQTTVETVNEILAEKEKEFPGEGIFLTEIKKV